MSDPLLEAPCHWCGYNGPNYWQAGTHHEGCPVRGIGGMVEREHWLSASKATRTTPAKPLPSDEERHVGRFVVATEARRLTKENIGEVSRWCGGTWVGPSSGEREFPQFVNVKVGREYIAAQFGDWIVRATDGSFHPCKPEAFEFAQVRAEAKKEMRERAANAVWLKGEVPELRDERLRASRAQAIRELPLRAEATEKVGDVEEGRTDVE